MERGFFKIWRKIQDSASWNRGLMYQGLMVNFLNRAAWKKSSFKGRELQPGQFGTVLSQLAESLGIPRSTLQRMVAHLEADEFLSVENMGNRFTVITIMNWQFYQGAGQGAWATNGQPTVNQRATNGQPPYKVDARVYKAKESKKEEYIPPLTPPDRGEGEAVPSRPKKERRSKASSGPSLDALIEGYTESPDLRRTLADFRQMRERLRKPMTGRALELILKKLDSLAATEPQKIAVLEQSIVKSWQDVFPLREPAFDRTPPEPPPKTQEQKEAEQKQFDAFVKQLREQNRRESEARTSQKGEQVCTRPVPPPNLRAKRLEPG